MTKGVADHLRVADCWRTTSRRTTRRRSCGSKQAGGVILGKTNCDEFAMGSSNENSAFGPVRNPVAPDRVPGGSSGGSAAVVAQGTAVVSLGSDTGGSVRQPASFCGVVGVTPTYGRVSRYGLTAFASSLDHIGPFARNVRDAATLLQVMAGRDEHDSTSAEAPVPDYTALLDGNVKGLKLGLPREYLKDLTSETGDLIARGVEQLKKLGCEVREISLPATEYAIACYYIIATAEASSNLARYDGVRYTTRSPGSRHSIRYVSQYARRGLRRGVQAAHHAGHLRAERGILRCVLSEGAEGARADCARFCERFRTRWMRSWRRFRRSRRSNWARRWTTRWPCTSRTFTPSPASLAGIPCMSVPCGKTADGLPVGMQILTRHFDETDDVPPRRCLRTRSEAIRH